MAKLLLENIYKVYPGNVTAVEDFNLEIDDKEFVVFVGPSGCGKSTTLRMIAGLEEITKGILKIDNNVVNDVAPKDRDIAMVFQNYALYPHMSVRQNMAFGLKLRKLPKEEIEKKVLEASKLLEIEHLLDRKPKALSGGQRQRVALGRAIVRNPKVFLMDEPLSNLDAKLRVQMRTVIAKLHKKLETTFIYVTHDQTEAMTMGTRIVVMKDGLIYQVDTPSNIYEHPKNMFVAGFVGSPQMNFINCMISKEGNEYFAKYENGLIKIIEEHGNILEKAGYVNKEVVVGIRPENIREYNELETQIDVNLNSIIETEVDVVENMGAETYIYLSNGKESITARVEGVSKLKAGDKAKMQIDNSKIHIFDKETEITVI